jgi:hypothetical protein
MTHKLQGHDWVARREPGRVVREVAAVMLVACLLTSWPARAQGENAENAVEPAAVAPAAELPAPPAAAPVPVAPPPSLPLAPSPPAAANPALDVRSPAQEPAQPSVFRRWWFWTAVGAVAAGTVAVIWISSRGHAPPATDLGNQEFQP